MVLDFWGKHQPTSGAFPVAVEMDEGCLLHYRFVMVIPWNCLLTCLVLILATEHSSHYQCQNFYRLQIGANPIPIGFKLTMPRIQKMVGMLIPTEFSAS